MMKQVEIFLADGFEEIEALTVVDVLRRAGISVEMVSVTKSLSVKGSHGISVMADILFEDMDVLKADMLVLPGGMPGTLHLGSHEGLATLLKEWNKKKQYIGAICAAPSVLGKLGILDKKEACCYPSFEDKLTGAKVVFTPVACAENIITSRGMGTAIPFALQLTTVLCGQEKAQEISKSILFSE